MRAKALDIRESVFDNETEAILYVIKDTEGVEDIFVFSLPIYTFSWVVKSEKDFEALRTFNLFGSVERREKLIVAMKKAIEEFD